MPEAAHPLGEQGSASPLDIPQWELEVMEREFERQQKGWQGIELVGNDGENWPLDFAAKLLQLPERDLRDLIRIVNNLRPGTVEPSGTIRMAAFRRQGRNPRAYPGSRLLMLVEGVADLCEELSRP